jgi:hypothetical protein
LGLVLLLHPLTPSAVDAAAMKVSQALARISAPGEAGWDSWVV